ncbi:MAG: GEVED domain-containing protein [Rubripirellula sp.]
MATNPPAVLEDAGPQTVNAFATFDAGDPSESGQNVLAYDVSNVSRPDLFSVAPAIDTLGNLSFVPASNAFGASSFVATVQDDGGTDGGGIDTSLPQTFTITLTPVNDAPTLMLADPVVANEDSGPQSIPDYAHGFSPGPLENGDSLQSQEIHDEGANGTVNPLSTDHLNPTNLGSLTQGSNIVRGYVESAKSVGNVDVFTITVDAGFELSSLEVLEYAYNTPPANPNERNAFLAFNDGSTFPYNAFDLDINENPFLDESQFLGGTVFGLDDLPNEGGGNLLPRAAVVTGRGFTPPLAAGTYTFYVQQTGPANSYALDFRVSAVARQALVGYTVTNISDPTLFAAPPQIDATGTLTFTPADDRFGTATFDVVAQDDGGTTNGGANTSATVTGTITIDAVNDAPSFSVAPEAVVNEDSGFHRIVDFATNFDPGPGEDGTSDNIQVIHDEGEQGADLPLSTDNNEPTPLGSLSLGSNIVRGHVETAKNVGNVDVFTFTVEPGHQLEGLFVEEYAYPTPPSNPNEQNAFLAINTGTSFPYNAFELDINENPFLDETAFLGGTVFGLNDLLDAGGGNILPRAGVVTGRGFTGPLPSGTYTIYVQQTGPENSYSLSFQVTEVGNQSLAGYSVSNLSDGSLFNTLPSIDNDGNLTFSPAPDRFGTATFEVTAQDNGGTTNGGIDTSTPRIGTITINPVNDAPSFVASNPPSVLENAGEQTIVDFASDFDPGSFYESDQTLLGYSVTNIEAPSLFAVPPAVAADGTLTYTPAADVFGTSTFQLTAQDSGGTDDGGEDLSETKTLLIRVVGPEDFGDAPFGVPVQLADNGPHHALSSLFLGSTVSVESDGQTSAGADADDDDGVAPITTILTDFSSTNQASLEVIASEQGFLTAWIDFNQDQSFDTNERIYSWLVSAGSNTIPFFVPSDAEGTQPGEVAARFRLSSESFLEPTGAAPDGEVEDYLFQIAIPTLSTTVDVNLVDSVAEIQVMGDRVLVRDQSDVLFAAPSQNFGTLNVVATANNDVITLNYEQASVARSQGVEVDGKEGDNTLRATGDSGQFQLIEDGSIVARNFSTFDVSQSGVDIVAIEPAGILQFSPLSASLNVVAGIDNTFDFVDPTTWRMGDTFTLNDTFFRRVNSVAGGGEQLVLQSPFAWHNVVRASDVNNDGEATAADALVVINELRRRAFSEAGTQALADPSEVETWPDTYYDQNRDDLVTALDALRIINELARVSSEGESLVPSVRAVDQLFADKGIRFADGASDTQSDSGIDELAVEIVDGFNTSNHDSVAVPFATSIRANDEASGSDDEAQSNPDTLPDPFASSI